MNVKTKSTNKEHESKGSGSYLSACSSVFTFEEGSIDEPPDASGPVTQVWATPLSIPSTVDSTTQDGISDITREDYNHVTSVTPVSPAKYKNSANKWHISSHNNNTTNPTPNLCPISPTTILTKYSLPKSQHLWHKYKKRPFNHQPK